MAFKRMRKPMYRRKTYRKKARLAPRTRKAVRAVVKNVISRQAETKVYTNTMFGLDPIIGPAGTVISSENTIGTGTTTAKSLLYRELTLIGPQGTNDGERIGAKIFINKIDLKFSVQNLSTVGDDPFTNAYVRFLLVTLRDQGDEDIIFTGSPGNGESFFKRNGIATNVYDSTQRLLDRPNPDYLIVHKDMIIPLGPTNFQVPGNAPNETCTKYKRIVIPFNKSMTYVSTGSQLPQQHRMYAVWFVSRADGTVASGNKVRVNVNEQHDIYYKDM